MNGDMPVLYTDAVPTKLPKGVISTATLNIKNEENVAVKLLKGNAVQAESIEIGTGFIT